MKRPLRITLYATAAGLALAALAHWGLPAPSHLGRTLAEEAPLYSKPFGANPFAPGEWQTDDGKLLNWRGVPSAQFCAQCHQQEFREWSTSLHAISDLDAVYDASVSENTAATQAAQQHGEEKGRWCESCHNPLGTLTGAVDKLTPVPETEALEEGVSCVVCHAAQQPHPLKGNGALTMKLDGVFRYLHPAMLMAAPERHARDMQAKRLAPHMGESALCGACHTEIRPANIRGGKPMVFQETYREWQDSLYAKQGISCQNCHMARDPGSYIAALKRGERPRPGVSHRMPGGNYLLTDAELGELLATLRGGQPSGLNKFYDQKTWHQEVGTTHQQVDGLLRAAADLSVTPTRRLPDRLELQVTVRNSGAGHALPTGPLDQRHMWLELLVQDDRGQTLFHQGRFDDKRGVPDPAAPIWVKNLILDDGSIDRRHLLFDTARLQFPRKPIPAGGAQHIPYRIALPAGNRGKLRVTVRLWYRMAFQDILQNLENQGMGKVDAVIPPRLMRELHTTVPEARS